MTFGYPPSRITPDSSYPPPRCMFCPENILFVTAVSFNFLSSISFAFFRCLLTHCTVHSLELNLTTPSYLSCRSCNPSLESLVNVSLQYRYDIVQATIPLICSFFLVPFSFHSSINFYVGVIFGHLVNNF